MPDLPHLNSMLGRPLWTQDRLALAAAWPLICLFVCVAVWVVTYTKIDQDRQAAVADAQRQLTYDVAAYSNALANTVQKADQVLQLVRFDSVNGPLRLEDAAAQGVFPREQQLQALILDRRGMLKTASEPGPHTDFSQRDFFLFHRSHSADVLRIGVPIPDPLAPGNATRSVIQLTRRISTPNGDFDGVAVISVPASYFNSLPMSSNQDGGDFSAVVGRDRGAAARGEAAWTVTRVPSGWTRRSSTQPAS